MGKTFSGRKEEFRVLREREQPKKVVCVFVSVWSVAIATLETVPLQRALDDDDDARRRARFRWVGANSHKEKHTSILWVLTRTSLGQSCRMVEGGGEVSVPSDTGNGQPQQTWGLDSPEHLSCCLLLTRRPRNVSEGWETK